MTTQQASEQAMSSAGSMLIETDSFPIDFVSRLAENESWRKEVFRPVYHMHKWWAKRLGSIFRAILLGAALPAGSDLEKAYYERHDFSGTTVLDPFMGSGTTVGEAHKMGFTCLGRDINPVACESVRIALGPLDRTALEQAFAQLQGKIGNQIADMYTSRNAAGTTCDVLYWFWVMQATCPGCGMPLDLFPSRVIARNAYPHRHPEVQLCCPCCGDVFEASSSSEPAVCPSCAHPFDPCKGTVDGTKAHCLSCPRQFQVAGTVRESGTPPRYRLYAKLLLTPDGDKIYERATSDDVAAYERCSAELLDETCRGSISLPSMALADGHNTRQALNYNFRTWRDFFNHRQLLALSRLHSAIVDLGNPAVRDPLLLLFSGLLEFNNMFASYKGEGTGAVRHMFSNHILKPERMPIEANIWGTPKSSGSFSNLFKLRLLRAIEYRGAPFELSTQRGARARVASRPFSGQVSGWPKSDGLRNGTIYLSCGSSDKTELKSESVDLVVTDPPFFDNVHYAELADFFYAWQTLCPRGFINGTSTTRNPHEVQDVDADEFARKLGAVFLECHRVLKPDGMLVFSYHHSRSDGWQALASAVYGAGFSVLNAHPVKSEMSVAAPKALAKEPIQLDVVLVCRKKGRDRRPPVSSHDALLSAEGAIRRQAGRLLAAGLRLSRNDCRVIAYSRFLVGLGGDRCAGDVLSALADEALGIEAAADAALAAVGADAAAADL